MSNDQHQAWAEDQCQSTLSGLKSDYPRYTDNELYAIWCALEGLLPLDIDGKIDLDQWRIHASHDGRHLLPPDGFRVSRALYGRALKANKGVPKPARVVKKKGEREPTNDFDNAVASEHVLEFARKYHEHASTAYTILQKREELRLLMKQLGTIRHEIAIDLAMKDPRTRTILVELGVLPE
jgi:hypothetical protein